MITLKIMEVIHALVDNRLNRRQEEREEEQLQLDPFKVPMIDLALNHPVIPTTSHLQPMVLILD
jgi:hypothetical protein